MIDHLLNEAKRLISEEPSAIQVNLIAAADGRVYSFFRYDLESEEQEECFLEQMTADKAQVQCIVCMWNDGTIDMPRYSQRKKLMELDSANGDARVLLFGEHGISMFPLAVTMPKKK